MEATSFAVGSLDDYLDRICRAIQLSRAQFESAERRYHAVGEWLIEQDTPLERLSPDVYPQGSMLQRTTIRPLRAETDVVPFDIDTVCRCDFDPHVSSSKSLYGSVQYRLLQNKDFARRIVIAREQHPFSGKCIRMAYPEDDFYLDVVPACKDPFDPEGIRILMCEPQKWENHRSAIETWRKSDPIRFAGWLHQMCETGPRRLQEFQICSSVAPVPPQEPVNQKAPLRRIIQLMKRQRDNDFLGDKCRPASIMVTTLAGRHYRGETSIEDGLDTVLTGIRSQIEEAAPARINVPNPADEIAPHDGGIEDLAAPLTNAAYVKFCTMIENMQETLSAARVARGPRDIVSVLSHSFGQKAVSQAVKGAQEEVSRSNSLGLLGTQTEGPYIHVREPALPKPEIRPSRPSNFHGD